VRARSTGKLSHRWNRRSQNYFSRRAITIGGRPQAPEL